MVEQERIGGDWGRPPSRRVARWTGYGKPVPVCGTERTRARPPQIRKPVIVRHQRRG